MAEFCEQCAASLDFPAGDFRGMPEPEPGQARIVLCEGCGPATVDRQGRCLGNCLVAEHEAGAAVEAAHG